MGHSCEHFPILKDRMALNQSSCGEREENLCKVEECFPLLKELGFSTKVPAKRGKTIHVLEKKL